MRTSAWVTMTETAEPGDQSTSEPAAPSGAAIGVLDQVRERGFIRVTAADDAHDLRVDATEACDCGEPSHPAADSSVQNDSVEVFPSAHRILVRSDCFDSVRHSGYFVAECTEQVLR